MASSTEAGIRHALAPYAFPPEFITHLFHSIRPHTTYHDATLVGVQSHTHPLVYFFHNPTTFTDLDLPAILEQAIHCSKNTPRLRPALQHAITALHNKNVPSNNTGTLVDRFIAFCDRGFQSNLLCFDSTVLEAWITGKYSLYFKQCLNGIKPRLPVTTRILTHGINIALKTHNVWFLDYVFRIHRITSIHGLSFWSLKSDVIGAIFTHEKKIGRPQEKLGYQDILMRGIKPVVHSSTPSSSLSFVDIVVPNDHISMLTKGIAFCFLLPFSATVVIDPNASVISALRALLLFRMTHKKDYVPFKYCLIHFLKSFNINEHSILALFGKKKDSNDPVFDAASGEIKPQYAPWLPLITIATNVA
jgi:hypothetical protein